MNIIFLDIDGVLNDNNSALSIESVEVLKELRDLSNAKIVMITSLQRNGTISQRKKLRNSFSKLGINDIDFIDPNFEGDICDIKLPSRVLGIIDYLKKEKDANYVILDDDYYNDYRLVCLNHYRTKPFVGLKRKDLPKIKFKKVNLNNFKFINYRYRELGKYEKVTNDLIKVLKKINWRDKYE